MQLEPACGARGTASLQWAARGLAVWLGVAITTRAQTELTITNLTLTVLRSASLPPAKKLLLSQLAREHGEWIETSGRLLSTENSRGRLALLLHDQGQNALAYV